MEPQCSVNIPMFGKCTICIELQVLKDKNSTVGKYII